MGTIRLTRGLTAIVDDSELWWISEHRFCAKEPRPGMFYAVRGRDQAYLHRLLMGCTQGDGCIVDHINGDTLDNRAANLRLVNAQQNAWNQGPFKKSLSRFRGVTKWGDRWGAQIAQNGRKYFLGLFDSEREAAARYQRVARRLRGEYHRQEDIRG